MSFPDEETLVWSKKKYGGSGSGSGGGKYKQLNYAIPAGTTEGDLYCVSETIPDVEVDAFGFAVYVDELSNLPQGMTVAHVVEATEDAGAAGVRVIRCAKSSDPRKDFAQFMIADDAAAELLGLPKGVYVLFLGEVFSNDMEVNIFLKSI